MRDDQIFILAECCSNPGPDHTQDWACRACVANHLTRFLEELAEIILAASMNERREETR